MEPRWVCFECTKDRGARIPEGHCYTTHIDTCGLCCRPEVEVTEPRDFGKTRSLLTTMHRDIRFIHYWKLELTNDELQQWIDKMALYYLKYWMILLEEKLRRVELEY